MQGAFLRPVEVPDGRLSAVTAPSMSSTRFPAIQTRLMLPLVILPAHHDTVLHPDTTLGELEPGFPKSGTEILSFTVGMKNICRSSVFQHSKHIREHLSEEYPEQVILHAVVIDRQFVFRLTLIRHVIRRVCQAHIRLTAIHQNLYRLRFPTITAHQPVLSQ